MENKGGAKQAGGSINKPKGTQVKSLSASASGPSDKDTQKSASASGPSDKDKKKAQQASEPQARVPGLVKPKPLVLEGASEKLKASALEVKKVLRNYKDTKQSCGTIKTRESLAEL